MASKSNTDNAAIRRQLQKLEHDAHILGEQMDNSQLVIQYALDADTPARKAVDMSAVTVEATPISAIEFDRLTRRKSDNGSMSQQLRDQLSILKPGEMIRLGPFASAEVTKRVQFRIASAVRVLAWPRIANGKPKGRAPYASSITADQLSIVFKRLA